MNPLENKELYSDKLSIVNSVKESYFDINNINISKGLSASQLDVINSSIVSSEDSKLRIDKLVEITNENNNQTLIDYIVDERTQVNAYSTALVGMADKSDINVNNNNNRYVMYNGVLTQVKDINNNTGTIKETDITTNTNYILKNGKVVYENNKVVTQEQKNKVNYYEEYYCGADVRVYIKGKKKIWWDEIATIQYGEATNESPIFGYMSQHFDAVARGTTIVQGQFGVALSDVNKLAQILYDNLRTLEKAQEYSYSEVQYSGSDALKDTWIKEGFDICIEYGDVDNNGIFRGSTSEVIEDVHITNVSKYVDSSENPIMTMYSFFGRKVK